MEFKLFLLLFCASVFAKVACGHSHISNLKAASKHAAGGLLQPRSKRQADPDDVCNTATVRDICTSGYYEDYAYVSYQCFSTLLARNIQSSCRFNSAGRLCGDFEYDREDFETACGRSPTTCTPECRDFLTSGRDELGCCVNVFNDSLSGVYFPDPFRYSLWSLCGLEPVAEQCASSFALPRPTFDLNCTRNSVTFQERLYSRVLCRAEFVQSLRNTLLSTDGCQNSSTLSDDTTCAVNERGQYCFVGPNLYDLRDIVEVNCHDSSVCEPLCIETLNNITRQVGCCFGTLFNDTENQSYEWLTNDYWQRCGLTSPGVCEQRFDHSPTRISATTTPTPNVPTTPLLTSTPSTSTSASTSGASTSSSTRPGNNPGISTASDSRTIPTSSSTGLSSNPRHGPTYALNTNPIVGSSSSTGDNTSSCHTLKASGVTVLIFYTTLLFL